MNTKDYIHGARRGREAHDLEAEAMRDPFLGDALEGFDAVPGDYSAAFGRLAGRVEASAAGGRAAARSKAARTRESRVRGWSVAAAAVFLVGVGGGVAWLMRDGIPADTDRGTIAGRVDLGGYDETEAILPPVTVIENEEETAPVSPPTDLSDVRLSPEEVRGLPEAEIATETEATTVSETFANIQPDTTTTLVFRRYIRDRRTITRNAAANAAAGAVTLRFEVDANGRPQNIRIVDAPTDLPEVANTAIELLEEGPDWPTEPTHKLIIINL